MPSSNKRSDLPEPVSVTLDGLTLPMEGLDFDTLLAEWRWLVDERYTPVLLTALGDLFLEAPDGSIHFLQTGAGQLDRVADSDVEFQELLERPEKVQEWFSPELVSALKAQGVKLGPGQCYGYMNPPCLGGRHEPLNLVAADIYVHFTILGQINYQVCDTLQATTSAAAEVETVE